MSKPIPKVIHLNASDFREAMSNLRRRGGADQRAFDEAARIIGSLSSGIEELNKLTNHGESRIQSCRKYDISNKSHRLVTVHSDNFIYLLFVGSHEETERWLDRNRGLTITCNPDTLHVTVTHITTDERREMPGVNYGRMMEANTPYFERIGGLDLTELVPNRSLVRELKRVDDSTAEAQIQQIAEDLNETDHGVANLILDIIFELREGNLDGAKGRLDQWRKQAVSIQTDPSVEQEAIASIANSDRAAILTGLTEDQLRELFAPDRFQEWMLFLHPEQKRIAEGNYDRPVVLTGVSGSGKTCVLVHRARHLVRKYRGQRIGVLTLNRSLSRLITNLVAELCTDDERQDIVVMAFYDYFKQLAEHFGPAEYLSQLSKLAEDHEHGRHIQKTISRVDPMKFAREFDPLAGENLEDTWEIYRLQDHTRTRMMDFANHVRAYQPTIDPDEYLHEEFNLIRSSTATVGREQQYLKMKRAGRAISFLEKIRRLTLNLLLLWEETMLHGGVLDELSLTAALLPSRRKFRELPDKLRFRCLLIDEFQDFSTLDLALLRLIPTTPENGLFVAGDPVQRVLVKSLKLGSVGLDIISAQRERITKNYRNSRQILQAASHLANLYGQKAKDLGEDIEILDPELAIRETSEPLVLQVSQDEEIIKAWELAQECLYAESAAPWSVCIATACPHLISAEKILASKPAGFSAARLTGDYARTRDSMIVGTTRDVKGFEFSMVIVLGCRAACLPNPGCCKDEAWREALRLYVAMTRARDSLLLLYSGEPSEFLMVMKDDLNWRAKP